MGHRKAGKAAVIPLDFSIGGSCRQEHTVLYFNPNWCELAEFLENPLCELYNYRKKFKSSGVDWNLKGPVTAYFEPVTPFGRGVADDYDVSKKVARDRFLALSGVGVKALDDENLDDGAFMIEFAPFTRSLFIAYLPPKVCIDKIEHTRRDPCGSPVMNHYPHGSSLTKITLGKVSVTTTATAHFDIGRQPKERAGFIVDHLENPARSCQLLNLHRSNNVCFPTALTPEDHDIPVSTPNHTTGLDPFRIRPSNVALSGGSGTGLDPRYMLPRMFVEDIDNTDMPFVCGIAPISVEVVDDQPVNFLGTITLKNYPPPSTQP